jgi:Tfp pilus assembly protein PilV
MPTKRFGTSLCEVLLALVLVSATASWALRATAATERALGNARHHQAARHRAERALADLNAMPCDSINVVRSVREPRWQLTLSRDHDGLTYRDEVFLHSARRDSMRLALGGWCD